MASTARNLILDKLDPLVMAQAGTLEPSVYGVVDRVDNIDGQLVPNIVRRWKGTVGNMLPTEDEPTILLIERVEPLILKHKKYKCLYGGRAGTKSRFAQDVMAGEINSVGSKVYVLRERMKSLKESIYAGIIKSIRDLKLGGFLPVPSHWEIRHRTGGIFTFGGMQNIIDMKGSSNYKFFLMEEAARTKQATIDTLGPTLRDTPGAELWYLWNPESSTDAMSNEFITPYQADIDRQGYYEDDYHLIIRVNWQDNPWFEHDDSLSTEYAKDHEKMQDGRMSKSRFNHIWNGEFSDDVESSVILPDWFDACIDAHHKLGIVAKGAKVAAHDPADVGKDAKGYAERHGIVFTGLEELDGENANRAFDIACKKAKAFGADVFGWDCDGMGALLRDQATANLKGTTMHTFMYKGSESVHNPEAIFKASENYNMKGQKLNKDVFKNKKAQNIIAFAERVRKTYEAVVLHHYHNPEELVSFCSQGIDPKTMAKFRAECCKIPLKPSDMICFYTKAELQKGIIQGDGARIKIPSPNLLDSAVLSFDDASVVRIMPTPRMPRPYKPMGVRR